VNTNNAYYKFTGATIGNIFNVNQGQITFYLKSQYSFAQRQASASQPRYTFAVRDEGSGELLPIGKAYSGLTDAEIAELTEHFKQNTLVERGRYREVKPDIILEIAFNSIQPSSRHSSGLALRFPRIKAIRRDKTIENIDTLAYAQQLATEQNRGNSSPSSRARSRDPAA